ncbi:type II/IV secretion system ATPase subunit [Vulcanisaeta distributa]|nr:type II/IV secretion system ATPase subunit [Vulcanisaeta distributa]
MHVSRPKVIGEELVKHYVIEVDGIKTDIDVYRVVDPQYGTHDYIAYVIDNVPDWAIALPIEKIVEWIGSGMESSKAITKGLKEVSVKASQDNVMLATNLFLRWNNHYGPLTPVLMMDDVTDIYINKEGSKFGLGGIYVDHSELGLVRVIIGWEPYDVRKGKKVVKTIRFDFNGFVNYIMRRASRRAGTPITAYNPVASIVDSEFGVRISIEAEPVSMGSISIRVLPRRPWTLPEMVSRGMISIDDAARLWLLAEHKVPVLIIGPMGAGKTSLQNAIAYMLVNRPMAIIMDVAELFLPYHKVVKPMFERVSYAHGIRNINKAELIKQALRSGVDIIVLNEARSYEEFKALAEAITLGHGALTTFHADNFKAAEVRLENLGLEARDLLNIAVVVELGIMKQSRYNQVTNVYELVTHRFVRSIFNSDEYMKILGKTYGDEYVIKQLQYRRAFLMRAVNSGLNYEQLAGLLYAFYKDPEKFIKNVENNTAGTSNSGQNSQNNQEIPEEVLKLDEEFTNPFKDELK